MELWTWRKHKEHEKAAIQNGIALKRLRGKRKRAARLGMRPLPKIRVQERPWGGEGELDKCSRAKDYG